jgi:hypothetical protein
MILLLIFEAILTILNTVIAISYIRAKKYYIAMFNGFSAILCFSALIFYIINNIDISCIWYNLFK